jgi:hypothetical protein
LQKLLLIVKSQGKITDFHTAGTEEMKDQELETLQKLAGATALEAVAEEAAAFTPEIIAEEAIASEHSVSEVIEDVVVESAQYAGSQEVEQRQAIESYPQSHAEYAETYVPVEESMKVPASSYVAYETKQEEALPYQAMPQEEKVTPQPDSHDDKKDDDADELYSIRNFNL